MNVIKLLELWQLWLKKKKRKNSEYKSKSDNPFRNNYGFAYSVLGFSPKLTKGLSFIDVQLTD